MSNPKLGALLGSGKEAAVFEYGTLAVKLFKKAAAKHAVFREAANLALVESFGLPVPSVRGVLQIGDHWGLAMDRADGTSFADALHCRPHLVQAYLDAMVRLQLRIHSHPGTQLPSLKARLAANIRRATKLSAERRDALLNRLDGMPDGERVCHGDFHPLNILGPPDRALIVDWLDACRGEPAADVCRSYVLMRPVALELAASYVDAYIGRSGETCERVFDWLALVAAARLAEGLTDEEGALLEMVG
jgi:aminoglycoside phosphotransferase (APT) family kinase protein